MALYETLTNLYPVQKTLRWELKPIGKTREYLIERDIINTDQHLSESYKKIKKIIDRLHIKVINEALETAIISDDKLEDYINAIKDNDSKKINKASMNLRKEVVSALKQHPEYKNLFGKEILSVSLPRVAENEEELDIISEFNNFYTVLKNYNEVRENLYSAEEKHSTIAYRLINENLPKYIQNIKAFEKICVYDVDFSEVLKKLSTFFGEINLDEVFSLRNFSVVLTQNGIDKYNQIIGGISTEKEKIQGLNEIINLWNQHHDKTEKIPKFVPLFKQILTDTTTKSFALDVFESDKDVIDALLEVVKTEKSDMILIRKLFDNFLKYDFEGIYVKCDTSLTNLSKIILDDWSKIGLIISENYDSLYSGKKKLNTEAYDLEKEKAIKSVKSISLSEINSLINQYFDNANVSEVLSNNADVIITKIEEKRERLLNDINSDTLYEKAFALNKVLTSNIKEYLDAINELASFLRIFKGTETESNRNELFYGDFIPLMDALQDINAIYNKTRNYLTKKPYSLEKIKLNFDVPTLLDGWDVNKEKAYLGIIFMKDNNYYLGIMDKRNRKVIEESLEGTGDQYKKMEYKLLPTPNKMLPKVFFSKLRIDEFAPSKEILEIRSCGSFKKGDNFSLSDCHKLIDFFKEAINKHEDWSKFNFEFSDTDSYKDISEFYKEISDQGYKIGFRNIDASYIDNLVDEGKLYLFQIYNKDFSEFSKGNPNLQTIYWKMIFDERNNNPVVYKLNGKAEVFYRKASINIEQKPTHKKGEALKNKNPLNPKKESIFEYDLIKNKRFTEDKFLFHVPVTINYVSQETEQINELVRDGIKDSKNYIIGIDRGERNLLYAVVIDEEGRIVDKCQISLNLITSEGNGIKQSVDYHSLLDVREKERDRARKNWSSIEQIKDLKAGYLSQAVHEVVKLAVKYNALIVMEDLNFGFMRGRQKIEKQVYQDFERMLIQKLNFLVTHKERDLGSVTEYGGALKAFQLTNKFDSLSKLGRQTGVLFYIPAWNTSKIDPTTGFVNLLNTRYETIDRTKAFINSFDGIKYNSQGDYFEFDLDYSRFTSKAEGTRTNWTVCTYGMRLENYRNPNNNNMFETREYDPTKEFKCILDGYKIDYSNETDLKDEICKISDATFYKKFMHVLKMTLQIRNSRLASELGSDDYLQSCVMNSKGEFYNSNNVDDTLPKDADANGAYNIARKGLMLVNRIKDSNGGKIDMAISNKDWLLYAQENC